MEINYAPMDGNITYYNGSYSFISEKKHRKMKLEVEIREIDKSEEPDWEAMGIKPKNRKSSFKFRRCMIDTYDIEYIKEYDDKLSILKCTWMEESVIINVDYDTIVIKVNDLENANYEDGE